MACYDGPMRRAARRPVPSCPNPTCHESSGSRAVVRHSRLHSRRKSQRRYLCRTCGKTFAESVGTPYHRLRHSKELFDRVVALSLEGMSKSAIARVCGISYGTVARWLELASRHAEGFQQGALRRLDAVELQLDELRTHVGEKSKPSWIYTSVEVWSRLWTAVHVGRRTRRDALLHVKRVRDQVLPAYDLPLISTDGFHWYEKVIRRVFGPFCVHVQIEKRFQDGRARRTRTRLMLGTPDDLDRAMERSEDSRRINTAYVERLNLTIRRSLACLQRRTTALLRSRERLRQQVCLLQCYYNFVRPHGSLKFGKERRTPAMQAGISSRRLSLREIFLSSCPDSSRARQRSEIGLNVVVPQAPRRRAA